MTSRSSITDLIAAVREFVDDFPTDRDDQIAGALMFIGPAGVERVDMQPGQVSWLADLIRNELMTCRQKGDTGVCAHCGRAPEWADADEADDQERRDAEDQDDEDEDPDDLEALEKEELRLAAQRAAAEGRVS